MLVKANELKAGYYIPVVVNGIVTVEQIDSITPFENPITEDLLVEITLVSGKIHIVPFTCKIDCLT